MANRPYDNWGIQNTSLFIRSLHFHVPSMFPIGTKHIQRQFYSSCSEHLKSIPTTVEILANPLAHMHNLTTALSVSLTTFKVFTASTSLRSGYPPWPHCHLLTLIPSLPIIQPLLFPNLIGTTFGYRTLGYVLYFKLSQDFPIKSITWVVDN